MVTKQQVHMTPHPFISWSEGGSMVGPLQRQAKGHTKDHVQGRINPLWGPSANMCSWVLFFAKCHYKIKVLKLEFT